MVSDHMIFRRCGFTLMEILLTSVVVGIMATVAIPAYVRTVENGRQSQAETILRTIRAAELTHWNLHDTFTTSWVELNIDTPPARDFTYTLVSADTDDFLARAVGTTASYTITRAGIVRRGTVGGGPATQN